MGFMVFSLSDPLCVSTTVERPGQPLDRENCPAWRAGYPAWRAGYPAWPRGYLGWDRDAHAGRLAGRGRPGRYADLGQDCGDVVVNGAFGDEQPPGDLPVGQAFGE